MPKERRPCRKCRKDFMSEDRRTNQICSRCKIANSKLSKRECSKGARTTTDLGLGDQNKPPPPIDTEPR